MEINVKRSRSVTQRLRLNLKALPRLWKVVNGPKVEPEAPKRLRGNG